MRRERSTAAIAYSNAPQDGEINDAGLTEWWMVGRLLGTMPEAEKCEAQTSASFDFA